MSANEIQFGGRHYKKYKYQPWDVVIDWNLGYLEGTALKYISRWRDKGGLEDINKAIHFLQKLIEVENERKQSTVSKLDHRAGHDAQCVSEYGAKDPLVYERRYILPAELGGGGGGIAGAYRQGTPQAGGSLRGDGKKGVR